MGKKFSTIAAKARKSWSDEALRINEAASQTFSAEMDLRVELGVELANLRHARNLTQPDLQRLSGVQQAEISRIERGIANPTLATIEKLTRALGSQLTVLVRGLSDTNGEVADVGVQGSSVR